ncbi:hypothetical protein scyTo_0019299 [Scyliorhinus torazame]|uniref:Uncharacterized protein n=1 Tax=Scyliorhinus torazame TaxID=75743 RepID=A0A401PWW2_SCYTO|nr:hypothetical protein [Scyliorhinus torazame]
MNQNQLGPQAQTAHTPRPSASSLDKAAAEVHSFVASAASDSAASPFPTTGAVMAQSVASPGTYIQIPINAEVRCISTFSLPPAVQQKIFGGSRNMPKGGDCSKPTTAIYICPVNPVKVTEAKRLLPLMPKPSSLIRGARGATDLVQETPTASPVAKVLSKGQDGKMNKAGKEAVTTPTPVSVKFCNNLASQVLKTFVKQQAKGVNMDSLLKAYSGSQLDSKIGGSSFKENALLLFNGQLYFLAQKGIEIPTGADKGKLSRRQSGSCEAKMLLAEEERVEQRMETSQRSLRTASTKHDVSTPEMSCELDTKGQEHAVKQNDCLNNPQVMDMGACETSLHPAENGLDLAQEVVKQLPNSLLGSSARGLLFSKDKDLLLKAGIHADVRVSLDRISLIDLANTSGCQSDNPMKYIPKLSKEPDPPDLEKCEEHSWVPGLPELEECPELIREHDPTEFRECPELFKEAGPADSGEGAGALKVPDPVASQECPALSKELCPLEECTATSRMFSPAELEKCPAISKESSPLELEECHDYSKNHVTITLDVGVDVSSVPSTPEFGEHSEAPVNPSSADLMDCLSESEFRRKRKEVEAETLTSDCVNPDWTDQSVTAKRRKQPEVDPCSETCAGSQMETCGGLDMKSLESVDTENSLPKSPSCLEVSPALELNSLVAKEERNTNQSFHKSDSSDGGNAAGLSLNPLEVDETVRDEKINRLKEMLREKQAALDQMRKKISLSNTASSDTLGL